MICTVTLNPAMDKTAVIERLTPDAVNRIVSMRTDPGGKGINVSKVIARMGGRSAAFFLSGGRTGEAIAAALRAAGIETEAVSVPGETRTNLKIVDPVLRQNTDINEPGPRVSEQAADELLARLMARVAPGDIVVLAGSVPAGLPTDIYGRWTRTLQKAGARVFLDADGELLAGGVQAGPELVKPNDEELSRLVGRPLASVEALAGAARGLLALGVSRVVVSMGARGALFVDADAACRAPGLHVPVGSTVGAGDSVVAALALALEGGLSREETIRLAMAAGAANVMCSGTQAADREAVEALLGRVTFREI